MNGSRLARLDQQDADLVNLLAARYRIIEEVAAISQKLGFKLVDHWSVDDEFSGMDAAVLEAGEVTIVVVQGTNHRSNVSKYIEAYGLSVQHLAIKVDDIFAMLDRLAERGLNLIGDIYEAGGVRQALSIVIR